MPEIRKFDFGNSKVWQKLPSLVLETVVCKKISKFYFWSCKVYHKTQVTKSYFGSCLISQKWPNLILVIVKFDKNKSKFYFWYSETFQELLNFTLETVKFFKYLTSGLWK